MSRVQLALNVDDLDAAITFYSKLFNAAAGQASSPGYANFAIADPPLKLVLLENPGPAAPSTTSASRSDSSDTVHAEIARLTEAGIVHRRGDRHHVLLCHAGQGVGDRSRPGRSGRSTPCWPTQRPSAPAPNSPTTVTRSDVCCGGQPPRQRRADRH